MTEYNTTLDSGRAVEGVFGINKPQWLTSAGLLRDLQQVFGKSQLFEAWLSATRKEMKAAQARKHKQKFLRVKVGHGGTLDPLATGVMIVGIGQGTKYLKNYLECSKTYETVVLFGAATDSFDVVGKVVGRAEYEHVTRKLVESKLDAFRGKIMQKPSVFSALKVGGRKMYEIAREGGEIPEVKARPVEVLELEVLEWLEPGKHKYEWPVEQLKGEEGEGVRQLLGIRAEDVEAHWKKHQKKAGKRAAAEAAEEAETEAKRQRRGSEPMMSGALPVKDTPEQGTTTTHTREQSPRKGTTLPAQRSASPTRDSRSASPRRSPKPQNPPPAVRIRLTVTSGFYVRSFAHDLGLACDSMACMASLVRTRQGEFELGRVPANVLDYEDFEKSEICWGPKIAKLLDEWSSETRVGEYLERMKRKKKEEEEEEQALKGEGEQAQEGEEKQVLQDASEQAPEGGREPALEGEDKQTLNDESEPTLESGGKQAPESGTEQALEGGREPALEGGDEPVLESGVKPAQEG